MSCARAALLQQLYYYSYYLHEPGWNTRSSSYEKCDAFVLIFALPWDLGFHFPVLSAENIRTQKKENRNE